MRRLLIAGVAVLTLAGAGWAYAAARTDHLAPAGQPGLAGPPSIPGSSGSAAVPPEPHGSGSSAAEPPAERAQPKPYVPPRAQSRRTPHPQLATPQPVPVDDSLDGCDNSYGTAGQCVPWTFPPGTADGCRWLADHGFGPLQVHGRDRHDLDRNGDGIACGPGD